MQQGLIITQASPVMNFRTVAQMNDHILAGLTRIPHETDLVVGIPRSGMLPATILALNLNIALTDVNGLLEGRLLEAGASRKEAQRINRVADAKNILVIDDSCNTGNELRIVRERIAARNLKARILYGAVYVTPEVSPSVDIYFNICPQPRLFEWNIMHHPHLHHACVDIDGVLCSDPTEDQNDDGNNYLQFLKEAPTLWIPSYPIGWLVTSRLEKYRPQTEEWLDRHGVKYSELIMLDMDSAVERRKANCHGRFKADVYRSTPALLFIESNSGQAREIAERSGKPAFCTADRHLYFPSTLAAAGHKARNSPTLAFKFGRRIASGLKRRLWRKS